MEAKEQYFQSIARHFIYLRGTPFFLSSRELDIIGNWERQGIPLPVVLEGIKAAYIKFKQQRTRQQRMKRPLKNMARLRGRKLSLVFCQPYVLRAFEQYRNRKVGQRGRAVSGLEKTSKIKAGVKKFLADMPEKVLFLEDVFIQLDADLSQGDINEERLEEIEASIESLLWDKTSPGEIEQAKLDIQDEFQVRDFQELARLARIKVIKRWRDEYKIPYISLFYY